MASYLHSGAYLLQIAILDSNLYPMGTLVTPDSPSAGTEYNPLVVEAFVEWQDANPTYENAYSRAGNKLRGRRQIGATDYGVATLTLSEDDDVFEALVLGFTLDTTTATNARIRSANASRVQQRNFMVAMTTGATGENSAIKYDTIVVLNCYFEKATQGINQTSGPNPNNKQYNMYINAGTRAPWGQLLSAATVAPDGDADTLFKLSHTYPYMFMTYVDNNSDTTFTLPYTPASTEHAGADNIFFNNGTDLKAQVSGISGTTVTITAQTSGSKWVVWFPSSAAL